MKANKTKYLLIGVITVILLSVFIVGTNLLKSNPKEVEKKSISKEETQSMLSYTLDGEKTDIKPTKEDGYIANKVICEKGSNFIWDNTNWEVEIISLESNDVCSVDFTKDVNTNGYRVTATTNVEGSIDSLSKSTIENGTIIFYPNKGEEITGVSGCTGVIENNRVIVNNVTSNQTCNIEVKIPLKTLYVTLSDGSKYTVGTRDISATSPIEGTSITQGYKVTSGGTNYTGGIIFKTGNDYYFAGNPSDNWVLFANKYWRIIRSNSSEGTRLLYAGTSHNGQDGYIYNSGYAWNGNDNNYQYAYWYDTSNGNYRSNLKDRLDNWYSSNIGNNSIDDSMINSIVYCNDASYSPNKFEAYIRLVSSKTPSYTCGTNKFGSAAKVGLMTADEIAYAGGVYHNNAPNTYYYRNSKTSGCTGSSVDPCSVTGNNYWWTLSPFQFHNDDARVFIVYGADCPGQLTYTRVNFSYAVRPVITLKPEVKVSGSGTTDDPFIPSLTN